MRRKRLFIVMFALAALTALSVGIITASASDSRSHGVRYQVSITNLTRSQPLSPVVVATHHSDATKLFTLGSPASDALAALAEDAINDGVLAAWDPATNDDVVDLQTIFGVNGPILPGETASVIIEAGSIRNMISLASMLVNTNDAFTALNGVRLPVFGRAVHMTPAYDAGSEANNEDCGFIPGPACGNPGVRDESGAEGYVHVHSGIHGVADLDPAQYDWRNPVASITITRMR